MRPRAVARRHGRALRPRPQRRGLALPVRARGRPGGVVRRGRGLRSRRLPLPPGEPAATVPDGRRGSRPLGGSPLPHPPARHGRAGGVADPRRPLRARAAQRTLKEPFIWSSWGSQTYRYVPFLSVTRNVLWPMNPTGVALFTLGPRRWKLWELDLSDTLIT